MSVATMRSRSLVLWGMGLFLAMRVVSALIMWRAAGDQAAFPPWTGASPGYLDLTVLWDGSWYRTIAEQGYPQALPVDAQGVVQQNAWAFYPVFPLVSAAVMAVTGLSFPVVASSLALAAGVIAGGVIAVLLARVVPARVALATVLVLAAAPPSPTFQIAYTESFALLLLAVFLLLVTDGRWLAAGLVALVIGLTRPIAAPLGVVLVVALLVRWRARRERPVSLHEAVSALAALVLTAVSVVEWPTIVGLATGRADGYTQTMAAWRVGHTITPLEPWRNITRWCLEQLGWSPDLAVPILAVLALLLLAMVLGPWARALGAPLRTWCLAYPAYLVVVLDPFTSLYRYLLLMFPLGVVFVGGGWSGRVSRWLVPRTLVLVALGIWGQVWWVWNLLLFVPPSDYPP